MVIPKKLTKGSKVGLIAASSAVPQGRLESAVAALGALGLKIKVGESCKTSYGFLSAPDEIRIRDINAMFADEELDGVFCVRGGYGAARTLPYLDYDMIKRNAKVFAGYSDVTALHIAFNQICGFVTFHAPMASTELYAGVDEYTMNSFTKNTFTDETPCLDNAPGEELAALYGGCAEGEIIGGNLSLIAASMGTRYEIDTRGKILFIEDIDEEPYRIDRMLNQLRQGGKLDDCAGIILGAFTNCEPKEPQKSLSLAEVINDMIVSAKKPTVSGFSCGHCLPSLTLPLGMVVRLDAGGRSVKALG